MKFSLLAMDLDGTALQPDGVSFSPRLMAALEEVHRRGTLVVPTTGRPYAMLPPVLKEKHDWLRYAIVCDGSEIRRMDTGECVLGYYLPRQTIQDLIDLADAFELPLEISAQNQLYLTRTLIDRTCLSPDLSVAWERPAVRFYLADACDPRRA